MKTRCCLCGRFMSDDDVLLGYSYDCDNYTHYDCMQKLIESGKYKESEGGVSKVESPDA